MSDPRISIHLPSSQLAFVAETDGDKTTIHSPEPAPPGATVRGRIDNVAVEFQLKVRNCKKVGDVFVIDGRLRNATRKMKAALTGGATSA